MDHSELAALAIVTVAGLIRGITGFGGAMLMTPPLSLLLGPVSAVVISLSLETMAALVTFRDAWPRTNKRTLAYLIPPAIITAPLGGYLLLTLDPGNARKLIGAVVVAFSGLLLAGLRYTGTPRPATSLALGGMVGVLVGATSMGAPPVILYLLSGPDSPAVSRANLTVFVTAASVIGLAMLMVVGATALHQLQNVALLCLPYLGGTWVGASLFERMSDIFVRRLTLGFMLTMGLVSLLL
jgi:uncharacterized membrane protein YfcA